MEVKAYDRMLSRVYPPALLQYTQIGIPVISIGSRHVSTINFVDQDTAFYPLLVSISSRKLE